MPKQKHEDRLHALLSASGASRWLACTPSPRLEEGFEDTTSDYAKEGTLAHEFGDAILKGKLGLITPAKLKKHLDGLKKSEFYSPEMDEEVEKYTSYVWEEYTAAKTANPSALLLIEQKIDYSEYAPGGFGTGDATIVSDGILDIQDLKYGKGVKVDAENNPQLMLYGLGSYLRHELTYDIHTVRLTIVQPRLNNISVFDISVEELLEWAENTVKPAAEKAFKGEGELKAGSHCRWCKVKNRCPALTAHNLTLANLQYEKPRLLTDEQLVTIYLRSKDIQKWLKGVSEYMLEEAKKGKVYEGLKLVSGRSSRNWTDEEKVIALLTKKGYKLDQIVNTKIKGIGDIEKLLTKKAFPEIVGKLVIKPEGSPSLVEGKDERTQLGSESAKEDFKEPLKE